MRLDKGKKLINDFLKTYLTNINPAESRWKLLEHSLNQVKTEGLYLEFGVWRGASINFLADLKPNQKFYGFDSFEGLPEDWSSFYPKGHMKENGPPQVRKNIELIVGLFQDTLEIFLEEHKEKVAFLHLDADLYSSTKYVLFTLADKGWLQKGMVIEFDEVFYQDSPNTVLDDEYRVFLEFIDTYDVKVRWLKFFQPRKYHQPSPTLRASLIIEDFKGKKK